MLFIGELATKMMGYKEGKVGDIIRIFRNTAYLRTVDDDLICITSHKIRGPMNVNVSGIDLSGIKLHEPVYKEGDALRIHDSILSSRDVPIYRGTRQCTSTDGLDDRVLSAADVITSLVIKGSILDSESFFFDAFSRGIKRIARSSTKKDVVELQRAMRGLVGLGNGATPSGDDFLAGFLFCLRTIAGKGTLEDLKFKIDDETSWHSRKFIEYAQDGFVIEPIENFTISVLSGFKEGLSDSVQGLLGVGHSSGIDAALGVIFATTFGKDIEYCEVLLRKFRFRHQY